MSQPSFMIRYAQAFSRIPGWFSIDAYLLMCLYHQMALPPGDVLEIGVYQGLSAIGVAAMRGPNRRFFAIDPFVSATGEPTPALRDAFLRTMQQFYPTQDWMICISAPSHDVSAQALGDSYSLVHIDGDHSAQGVLYDLDLAYKVLQPSGILVLDDYYNPHYPGVSFAVHDFLGTEPRRFRVVAGGLNKLVLQKEPVSADVNAEVRKQFPMLGSIPVTMWGHTVLLYSWGIGVLMDLNDSTPHKLVGTTRPQLRAKLHCRERKRRAAVGETIQVPVTITNQSSFAFQAGAHEPIKLGYRLFDARGRQVAQEISLTPLKQLLYPDETMTTPVNVIAPIAAGRYEIEFDLVWEHVAWFREAGNRTVRLRLDVM